MELAGVSPDTSDGSRYTTKCYFSSRPYFSIPRLSLASSFSLNTHARWRVRTTFRISDQNLREYQNSGTSVDAAFLQFLPHPHDHTHYSPQVPECRLKKLGQVFAYAYGKRWHLINGDN